MLKDIDKIREDALNQNIEISIGALDLLLKDIDTLSDVLFDFLTNASDHFLIAERISLAFTSYIEKLESCLTGNDSELSYWAATLIVHYRVKNNQAEKILLEQVVNGNSEKAQIATTILCRNSVPGVESAIIERLSLVPLDISMKSFLEEKLSDLNPKETS
jgi:hypothetical protein